MKGRRKKRIRRTSKTRDDIPHVDGGEPSECPLYKHGNKMMKEKRELATMKREHDRHGGRVVGNCAFLLANIPDPVAKAVILKRQGIRPAKEELVFMLKSRGADRKARK